MTTVKLVAKELYPMLAMPDKGPVLHLDKLVF